MDAELETAVPPRSRTYPPSPLPERKGEPRLPFPCRGRGRGRGSKRSTTRCTAPLGRTAGSPSVTSVRNNTITPRSKHNVQLADAQALRSGSSRPHCHAHWRHWYRHSFTGRDAGDLRDWGGDEPPGQGVCPNGRWGPRRRGIFLLCTPNLLAARPSPGRSKGRWM